MIRIILRSILAIPLLLSLTAVNVLAGVCDSEGLTSDVPQNSSAPSGAAIAQNIRNTPGGGQERDNQVLEQISCGNLSPQLSKLVPVKMGGITICVMPDYLSLGNNDDNIRVPLGLPAAMRAAQQLGMTLPTKKMVDAIYAQADTQLIGRPRGPSSKMENMTEILANDETIDGQLKGVTNPGLIAGHKKDVVIANRLASKPGSIAIYGWQKSNPVKGQALRPWQPLSTPHHKNYADYSHGIRFVSQYAYVDGKKYRLNDLLTNPKTATALNHQGVMPESVLKGFEKSEKLPNCSSGSPQGQGRQGTKSNQ